METRLISLFTREAQGEGGKMESMWLRNELYPPLPRDIMSKEEEEKCRKAAMEWWNGVYIGQPAESKRIEYVTKETGKQT